MEGRFAIWSVVFIAMLACANTLNAQDGVAGRIQGPAGIAGVGGGYLASGVGTVAVNDLNDYLGSFGFSTLPRRLLSVGVGGFATLSPVVVGGEAHGLFSTREHSLDTGVHGSLSGGYGLVTFGVPILSAGRTTLMPTAGLGVAGIGLDFSEEIEAGYGGIVDSGIARSKTYSASLLLDASVALFHRVQLGAGTRAGGLIFGLRAGYMTSPLRSDWRSRDISDWSGPTVGLHGQYVHLSIGGWGRRGQVVR